MPVTSLNLIEYKFFLILRRTQTYRKEIEHNLIKQNKCHYKKAMGTKAYQDRIYPKLLQNNIRNKILRGTLAREDYSNPEVYDFL